MSTETGYLLSNGRDWRKSVVSRLEVLSPKNI